MNKKILILTGVLVAGAVGVLVVDKAKEKAPDERLGKPLVAAADITNVDHIKIDRATASVTLVLGADKVWRLGDADGFPADAAKITRFLDSLTTVHTQILASSAKDRMSEFGFDTPTSISLQSAGKDAGQVRLGGNRERGGQYVAFGDNPNVYLIAQNVSALADAGSWEMKTLADIKPEHVKRVEFSPAAALGKKSVSLSREKAEDPVKVDGLAADAQTASTLRTHEGLLSGLSFSQRIDAGNEEYKTAMAKPSVAKVSLFDGRIYTVKVGTSGKDNKKYFIQIDGLAGEGTPSDGVRDVEALNGLMTKYAFEVPSYIGSKFEKGMDDMLEKQGS